MDTKAVYDQDEKVVLIRTYRFVAPRLVTTVAEFLGCAIVTDKDLLHADHIIVGDARSLEVLELMLKNLRVSFEIIEPQELH